MAQLKDLIVNGSSQLIGNVNINAKLIDGIGSSGSNGQVLLSTGNKIQWSNMPETYSLPMATNDALGGIKTGYSSSDKNYAVQVDSNGKAYVNVPWSETNNKTDITVLPNDIDQIKTKFRLNNRNNTGNKATAWYYKLCTLPVNNGNNSASLIFSGRLGGYTSGDMSYFQGMAWNRGTPGIAIFDIGGTATSMAKIFEICDIVGYVNGDSIDAQATLTIYILCHGYFTYDLDLELYQSSSTFDYDGTYITTVPTGTLAFQASTSNKRVEMINSKLLINGTEVVINTGSWDITAKNVSKKLIIGSYEYDGSNTVTIPIYNGTYS